MGLFSFWVSCFSLKFLSDLPNTLLRTRSPLHHVTILLNTPQGPQWYGESKSPRFAHKGFRDCMTGSYHLPVVHKYIWLLTWIFTFVTSLAGHRLGIPTLPLLILCVLCSSQLSAKESLLWESNAPRKEQTLLGHRQMPTPFLFTLIVIYLLIALVDCGEEMSHIQFYMFID